MDCLAQRVEFIHFVVLLLYYRDIVNEFVPCHLLYLLKLLPCILFR